MSDLKQQEQTTPDISSPDTPATDTKDPAELTD